MNDRARDSIHNQVPVEYISLQCGLHAMEAANAFMTAKSEATSAVNPGAS
jgi:hypothetical protein